MFDYDMTLDKLITQLQKLKDSGMDGNTLIYTHDEDGRITSELKVRVDNVKDIIIEKR